MDFEIPKDIADLLAELDAFIDTHNPYRANKVIPAIGSGAAAPIQRLLWVIFRQHHAKVVSRLAGSRVGLERGPDLLMNDDDDQAAENQKNQHPHQKNSGRGNLEWVQLFRHVRPYSAP